MKRISYLKEAAAVVFGAGVVMTSFPAQAQQHAPMTRTMRDVVANREIPMLRRLAPAQTLKLSIALPLRNQAELDALLGKLYNPQSPSYHHWLSVGEFTNRFGPSAEDYEKLIQFLQANGMQVKARTANRFLVDVDASVGQINNTFHVSMGEYRHPTENRTFYAPDQEPTLDLPFKIWRIEGLDNYSIPKPMLKHANAIRAAVSGSGPNGDFIASDFRAAYYGGSALTGSGQTIGLYGFSYNISDVENYYSNVGQPFDPSVVTDYSTDGTTNSCGSDCDDTEPVLDITSALSMAPGVNSVIEYFGNGAMDTFNAMASANVAKQLSSSVIFAISDNSAYEPIFEEFATQGQSFFQATGDGGAYSSSYPYQFPSDDFYVTGVGGTDLTTNGAGGSWQGETAWVGSGGGISFYDVPIPSYPQGAGIINSSNGGSTTLRNIPDVAAEANFDNWVCSNGTCGGGYGGTSFAAPRWAGFMALVNQQASKNGDPYVGFLNPIIYGNKGANFHDIVLGNDANSDASYNAVKGYDLVTGWGSPNGQALINELAPPRSAGSLNGTHVLAPASSPGLVLDDNAQSTATGNKIQIWPTNGTRAQSWVLSNTNVQPAGYYNISVSFGPYCATASGSSSGSSVNLQPCNGSTAQAWEAVPSGSGYTFHPANNTGLCMDVQQAGTSAGTLVWAYTCNGTNAQHWTLE